MAGFTIEFLLHEHDSKYRDRGIIYCHFIKLL